MDDFQVALPHGVQFAGAWQRTARLRSITGGDRAFLVEQSVLTPAQRTSGLLARCVTGLGTLEAVPPDLARRLSAGDREALLLHLYRATRGDWLDCVLTCPNSGCREQLELELDVKDLLHTPYGDVREVYEITVPDGEETYHACFRLPNGADQEQAAALAAQDAAAAGQLILCRCLESLTSQRNSVIAPDAMPDPVASALSDEMARLDPQAEIALHLTCPACETELDAAFDAGDFLYRELFRRRDDLYRQVHLLAYHYHWSESEIMGMSEHKRHIYLDLLLDELGATERV